MKIFKLIYPNQTLLKFIQKRYLHLNIGHHTNRYMWKNRLEFVSEQTLFLQQWCNKYLLRQNRIYQL